MPLRDGWRENKRPSRGLGGPEICNRTDKDRDKPADNLHQVESLPLNGGMSPADRPPGRAEDEVNRTGGLPCQLTQDIAALGTSAGDEPW